jgi:hypothetical protein
MHDNVTGRPREPGRSLSRHIFKGSFELAPRDANHLGRIRFFLGIKRCRVERILRARARTLLIGFN